MQKLLEIAVTSVYSAKEAVLGGASRLELCTNLAQGGITPSFGLIQQVKAAVPVPVFVLIRPRKADFFYDDAEFAVMLADIAAAKEAGADGIVSGILQADGNIDQERTRQLIEATRPLSFTFHRAFDMCLDPLAGMEQLIELGVDRILTSGQQATAVEGKERIQQLIELAVGRIIIMAGGGVRPQNIQELLNVPGLTEFHSSAKGITKSEMLFKGHTPMGSESVKEEFQWNEVDREIVTALRKALDKKR